MAFSRWLPIGDERPTLGHVTNTAYSLRPNHLFNGFLKEFCDLNHAHILKDTWCRRAFQFNGFKFLLSSNEAFSSKYVSSVCYFNGEEGINEASGKEGVSNPRSSKTKPFNQMKLTTALIAINASVYIADLGTRGALSSWGAKNSYWIRKGQWWRLVTCAFLHATPMHLLVNSWSLYSVGSAIETMWGPKRFLADYFISAIAGSGFSYWFQKSPSIGASGAICGLFGSYAVFVLRHKEYLDDGGRKEMTHIAQVIALNMALGLMVKRVDNWGHLGGFLGGAVASWLLGPALKYTDQTTADGKRIFFDRPPISYIINTNPEGKAYNWKSKN